MEDSSILDRKGKKQLKTRWGGGKVDQEIWGEGVFSLSKEKREKQLVRRGRKKYAR